MNIVVYSPRPWEVPGILFETGQHQLTGLVGEPADMVRQLTARKPDLVVLAGFENAGSEYIREVELLSVALPHAAIVALHPASQPELLISLMQAGVREVIQDSAPETLRQVIRRIDLRTSGACTSRGRVIGFVSSKGGDGSSCLAANLAFALSCEPAIRVLAIDASLPFGDLDMYLTGETHCQDLADISCQSDRLDRSLLDSMVQHLSSTFDLISSPATFEKIVDIEPARVSQLVQIARESYNFILVDLGSCIDQVGVWVLEQLDELSIVSTPSLPSLRRAGHLLKLSGELDKPVPEINIILNRADASVRLTCTEIEKVIERPIERRFPSDADAVEESLMMGQPLLQAAPESRLSKTIVDWALQLTGSRHAKRTLWERLKIR
ncbi:AAA family ATPase [Pelodictyon luteolum]|uniref:Flp pilus assembly protein ATPase CpaE-like protein n=1 Tax=Chlorobium luteolum (strain DSM 273 / BCRC 81028 / 2530) TaxID=319225 RepID=Q3B4R3_CHLL3|nr:AAA family ATPase [Pelodictyon luteolum]ABB23668.1 Flp pilus assembly protein ATPase CpaE-like protein [Pelodictyon luteolum DSM 273]